ncbi:MAG TPA: DUF1634 domain-containing protein [Thermomicrobiales bacterium]|jgi:uncharacterized membrane protein
MDRPWDTTPSSIAPVPSPTDQAMERWLGRVLRVGVAIAAVLILLGLVLFVAHDHGGNRISLDTALGRDTTVRPLGPGDVLDGLRTAQPAAYIELGLLVLILTPTVRVAMTVVLFERQHDWTFVALSAAVLAILVLGLFGVGA